MKILLPSLLTQNLDKIQNLDKQVNSNVNKEFLPKKSSQQSSQKILPPNLPKQFLKKIQKNSKKFSKNFWDFENIQFPTSGLFNLKLVPGLYSTLVAWSLLLGAEFGSFAMLIIEGVAVASLFIIMKWFFLQGIY